MWSSDDEAGGDDSDEERIPKRNRNGSRTEDALYGVFGEDDDEDDNDFSALKRKRQTNSGSMKPMKFVSGPRKSGEGENNDDVSADEEEDMQRESKEHENMFKETLGFSGSFGKKEESKKEGDLFFSQGSGPVQNRTGAPVEKPTWEKHTKGFGMKMLMKHGYKGGGLGKEGKGISRNVEVAGPRGTEGLGAVKESTNLKANKLIQKELTGRSRVDSDDDEDKRSKRFLSRSIAENTADSSLWRKGSHGSSAVSKKVKNSQVVLNKEAFTVKKAGVGGLVVDMRGAETRVLSTTDGLSLAGGLSGAAAGAKARQIGDELLHNLDLHVNLTEAKARNMDVQLSNEIENLSQLQKEVERLSNRVNQGKAQYKRFLDIEDMLTTLSSTSDPVDMIEIFQSLKSSKYNEEYVLFDLKQLTQTLIGPLLEHQLKHWNPLSEPLFAIDLLNRWKPLLKDDHVEAMDATKPWSHTSSLDSLEHIESAEVVVMRKIRTSIMEDWDAVSNSESCIKLIEALTLSDHFSAVTIRDLLKTVIFTKLKVLVDVWASSSSDVDGSFPLTSDNLSWANQYLVPWIPLLGDDLVSLFPTVRKKLLALIGLNHPGENNKNELVDIVQAWMLLFDQRSTEQFVTQVGVKLSTMIKSSFKVNPANQSLEVIHNVLVWCSLLPPVHVKCLLRGEFFPIWHTVLYEWLYQTDGAVNRDIATWYLGWKQFLSSFDHVREVIRGDLSFTLDIMKVCRDRQANNSSLPLEANFNSSYMLLLKSEETSLPNLASPKPSQPAKNTTFSNAIPASFREVVAAFAESRGIEFCIKIGRQFQGRQLYSFGNHTIYFDSDVVHVDRGGSFMPIGLEELVPPTS